MEKLVTKTPIAKKDAEYPPTLKAALRRAQKLVKKYTRGKNPLEELKRMRQEDD